jgi:replicative DNA helicase
MTFPFDARDEKPRAKLSPMLAVVRDETRTILSERDDVTPEEIVDRQVQAATFRLHADKSGYARFPWTSLDEVAGPMAPGELWLACARTGNGKTLFLLNLWAALIEAAKLCGLYIGLEQTAEEMRLKWACTMTGVSPLGILGGKWPIGYDEERIRHDTSLVESHMKRQRSPEIKALAHFSEARFIDADKLRAFVGWAVQFGIEFVITDHINRVDTSSGRNAFEGHTKVVRTAKELAVEHQIVMLAASQMGRPSGDPIQRFMPPALHEMRGGGTSEEEANTVLGIYRPLVTGINDKMLTEVRQGRREEASIYQENRMAVRVLKHRLDGMQLGNQALLRVEKGRVLNLY